jgi:hypothetical protein
MDKRQTARDQANDRAADFLAKYNTLLTAIATYAAIKAKFDAKRGEINDAKQIQFEETTEVTATKNIYHVKLIGTMFSLSNKASSQAFGADKPDLAAALDKPLVYFAGATEEDLIGRAKAVRKIFSDNAAVLTEITAADLIEIDKEIKDFENSQSLPKAVIKGKKAEGTDPLPRLFDEMDEVKHFMGNLIQGNLPDLFATWTTEIKVGKPIGTHKTSAVMHYTDAATGVPLRNIKVTITNGDVTLTKLSTKKGYVRLMSLKSDNYTITSEYPTFETDIRNNVGISADHIERLEIKLVKKIPTGTLDVTVFDKESAKPRQGVTLTIAKLKYTATSDENGKLFKNDIPPDTYEGILSLDGYQTIDFTFTIEGGKTNVLEFYLERIG